MKRKKIPLLLGFLLLGSFCLLAQGKSLLYNEELSFFLEAHPAEKVYLHTDREIYSVNDSIWFKTYLTHAHTTMPKIGLQSIYVEPIDQLKIIRV